VPSFGDVFADQVKRGGLVENEPREFRAFLFRRRVGAAPAFE
jgi:hypothetical protein